MAFGCCKKLLLLSTLVAVASVGYYKFIRKDTNQLPSDVYDDHYWGKKVLKQGEPIPKDDTTLRPLKVAYDEDVLKDLHERLNKTRFVEPLQNSFEDGFNGDMLKTVVDYWINKYDWKKQVDYLNSHTQFTTQIEGITVHFIRIKPTGAAKVVKPILLVNGWPSSIYQFYKLAELLRKPVNDVAFEVILVSRPGFGFSEQPHKSGFSISDSCRIYVKLMKRLGHEKFFYHGEDWGSVEGHGLSVLYPQNAEAIHLTMPLPDLTLVGLTKMVVGSYLPSLVYSNEHEAETFAKPKDLIKFILREVGYFILQATKPDTIGALLMDSPAGSAAYYLEKFSVGVNKESIYLQDGGLTKKFTLDELLTDIMILWTTENGAYSHRYLKEFVNKVDSDFDITRMKGHPSALVGFTIGEHEIGITKMKPSCKYSNILKFDYLMDVGHFVAFEAPTALDEHLRKFESLVSEHQTKIEKESKKEL